jgi:hypothetical protein
VSALAGATIIYASQPRESPRAISLAPVVSTSGIAASLSATF